MTVTENPNPLLLNDRPDLRPVALLQSNGDANGGDWGGGPAMGQVNETGKPDITVFLHAFRRHWLLAIGAGLGCALVVGLAVYLIIGEQFTAFSSISISAADPKVIGMEQQNLNKDYYDAYKATQEQKLLSRAVMIRALRNKRELNNYLKRYEDPVEWLTKKVGVNFLGKSELMIVSLTIRDPDMACALVKAVVDSYKIEVVDVEKDAKQRRFNQVSDACVEKEDDIRKKREELKKIASEAGNADTESLTQRMRHAYDELNMLMNQAAGMHTKWAEARSEYEACKELLKSVDKMEVPAADLDALIHADPVAGPLAQQVAGLKMELERNKMSQRPGVHSSFIDQLTRQLQSSQEQYDQKIDELKEKARDKRRSEIEQNMVKYDSYLNSMQKSKEELADQIRQKKDEAYKLGRSSVDSEMMRAEIRDLEATLGRMTQIREDLRVELNAVPRINIYEQAQRPTVPSNLVVRLALTGMLTLMSFCFPAALLIAWDCRVRRINTADDVSKRIGLPVIGSVPLIPSRVIRQLGSPSKQYESWHVRLTESVDGIAARILHEADVQQHRAIMVSSATHGEGKTTLATQLALSLARTGRRTVLVDFDLRRPSFDEMFGVPLAPGVCEFLREQNGIADLVQESGSDNLAVVAAGQWDRQAMAALSNGSAANLFNQLREEFEFVVVDSSPILTVADARFVSRHVDAVVLSVLRDVSEAPKSRPPAKSWRPSACPASRPW